MPEPMPRVPHYTRWKLSPEGLAVISNDERAEIKKSRSTKFITKGLGAIARNANSNFLDGTDAGLEAGNMVGLSLVRTSHGTEWDELFLRHTHAFLQQTGRRVHATIRNNNIKPEQQTFKSMYALRIFGASTQGMVQLSNESRELITHETHLMPRDTEEQSYDALGFDVSFGFINYLNNSLIKARARRN